MTRNNNTSSCHTNQTMTGNTQDTRVERIGPVTIYKRGHT